MEDYGKQPLFTAALPFPHIKSEGAEFSGLKLALQNVVHG